MQTTLLTSKGAAEYLAVKLNTLNAWRSRGEGPPFKKVGRCVRYSVAELDQWLEKSTRQSTAT